MHYFSNLLDKVLYMFQTGPLSIISSTSTLYTQQLVFVMLVLLASASEVRTMLADANITYLLTPWCRVLLEQLTGVQLVKKFPSFHGTRGFITALTSVCHLSLSWDSPIPPPVDPS